MLAERAFRLVTLVGCLSAPLAGCASTQSFLRTEAAPPPAPPPASPEAGPAPTTADALAPSQPVTLRVQDHLGWPFRLERLIISVDGIALQNLDRPRAGGALPDLRAEASLRPGEHTLSLLAITQLATTPGGHRCSMEVRTSRVFVTRAGVPAEVTADLFTRGVERDFRDRLAVAYRFQGKMEEIALAQGDAVTMLPCTTEHFPDFDADLKVLPPVDPLAIVPLR